VSLSTNLLLPTAQSTLALLVARALLALLVARALLALLVAHALLAHSMVERRRFAGVVHVLALTPSGARRSTVERRRFHVSGALVTALDIEA
jgi:hypothetical protein